MGEGAELKISLKVASGRGYETVEVRNQGNEETKAIGKLQLDATYSPVKRVSYSVESARVEQRTDLDKLVIDLGNQWHHRPRRSDSPFRDHSATTVSDLR